MATDLQVTTNKLSNKETQLTVKVPVEKIQNKVEGRIRQVAKTAKIDGFRKGNVPMSHSVHSTVLAFNKKLSTM